MNQTTIFDAIERGYASAKQAADNSGSDWQERALSYLRSYAICNRELQTWHVRLYAENLGLRNSGDDRAWGHIMRRAASDGIIRATEVYRGTDHAGSHGRPQRVWASLVFRGAA